MSKAEKDAILKMKPSAYRSMMMSKVGLTKKTSKNDLKRWTLEHWLNLNALIDIGEELPCGKKYKNQKDATVCRPKKKIDEKTASPLAYDLTKKQIKKAINMKNKGERIDWKNI